MATQPAASSGVTTCVVRYRTGAYVTNTIHGQRASSTMSATAAALLLAEKVHGPGAIAHKIATRPDVASYSGQDEYIYSLSVGRKGGA